MDIVHKKIIGTWKLIEFFTMDVEGNKTYPYGQDPIGCLFYDAQKNMSGQISRKKRPGSKDLMKPNPEGLLLIPQDYFSYFGKYVIDEKNHIVRHFIEGCIFPHLVGTEFERQFRFYDDKLSLKVLDIEKTTSSLSIKDMELIWKKETSPHVFGGDLSSCHS